MVTNNIGALQPGEGNYNFLLNAQGRIQGDATIYRDPSSPDPVYLLETDTTQIDALHQLLDKFIIMDDVELHLAYESHHTLLLAGSSVPALLSNLAISSLETLQIASLDTPNGPILLTTPNRTTTPLIELRSSPEAIQTILQFLENAGVRPAQESTLEQLRILEARPRYGTDIRNTEAAKDLPQETAQTHALNFAKGCYIGQEIVERIRSRGQVHRQFTPFHLEGTPPPATFPIPLEANDKPAGELTSATEVPTTEGPVWLALGYARREHLETHTPLHYPGGTAHPRTPGHLT